MAENTKYLVVDSSIFMCYLLPDEELKDEYRKYFENFDRGKIIFLCSTIVKYEILNSLISAYRQSRIDKTLVILLYKIFLQFPIKYSDSGFSLIIRLSLKHKLSVYDSCYLGLAVDNESELLTLDKRLRKAWQEEVKF